MRLGVIGGTFDPIHYAHLFIAEEAHEWCSLDRVLFVPNAVSPFKSQEQVTAPHHRLEMTRLAIADNPDFAVSTIEIDRPGPSYTVDTLRALRLQEPDAKIYFITGADAVAEVESWHEPEEVLRLARIIALTRPGFSFKAITSQLGEETLSRVDFIETLGIDFSATEIRDRVRQGLPIRYLTPDPVVEYIARHGLYAQGGTSPESA